MKLFQGDRLNGHAIELFHHMTGYTPQNFELDEWDVKKILHHRLGADGQYEFLTQWEGIDEETWEPPKKFCGSLLL